MPTKNPAGGYDPVTKPTSMNSGIVGKAPAVGRHAYGVFSPSSNAPGAKAGHTSNGIRNNSSGANTSASIQNNPGMAESLRAQIATPRNNQGNLEER